MHRQGEEKDVSDEEKQKSDKDKIIQSVLDELNAYKARFWAKEKMKEKNKNALGSKFKEKGESGRQLGYLKLKMKEEFVNELEELQNNNKVTDPQDVIEKIHGMIEEYKKGSRDTRTYIRTEVEFSLTKAKPSPFGEVSYNKPKTSHGEGRLDTIFNNIDSRLLNLTNSYNTDKQDLTYEERVLLIDIDKQIIKIEKNGNYNSETGKFECLFPEKYIHKHNMLLKLRDYLLQHHERHSNDDLAEDKTLSTVLKDNAQYDSKLFGRSDTGQLLDRVLALKHKNLEPDMKNKNKH